MLDCLGAQQRSFAKGAFIYRMGESITYVGIVLNGSVHVLQEDYWGNRTIVAHIEPGGVFGEALACAQIAKLPVSVMAPCDAVTLQIDYRRIITTCSSACSFHARLVRNMIGILAHNNVRLTQKMGHITQRTTREKLLSYLSAQAQQAQRSIFDIPFNRQELAEYLSVDRSALSNELSKMQRDHLLTYTRNHFELC
jgi:CRP-like cAMP-binding protein